MSRSEAGHAANQWWDLWVEGVEKAAEVALCEGIL